MESVVSAPIPNFILLSFLIASVDFSKTAFAGLAETEIQIDAGFVHGPANYIIADITRVR